MDPFTVLRSQQEEARAALVETREQGAKLTELPDEVEAYLDLEERIIYPMLDRCGANGSDAATKAMARHRELIEVLHSSDTADRALDAFDAHVALSTDHVYTILRLGLDAEGQDALGNALEEARQSRTETDGEPLRAPLDQVGSQVPEHDHHASTPQQE